VDYYELLASRRLIYRVSVLSLLRCLLVLKVQANKFPQVFVQSIFYLIVRSAVEHCLAGTRFSRRAPCSYSWLVCSLAGCFFFMLAFLGSLFVCALLLGTAVSLDPTGAVLLVPLTTVLAAVTAPRASQVAADSSPTSNNTVNDLKNELFVPEGLLATERRWWSWCLFFKVHPVQFEILMLHTHCTLGRNWRIRVLGSRANYFGAVGVGLAATSSAQRNFLVLPPSLGCNSVQCTC